MLGCTLPKYSLSAEAKELLAYVFKHSGQSPVVFDDDVVREVVRAGLAEHVTVGIEEPFVVLTPAGEDWCKVAVSSSGTLFPALVRSLS
jgi:hypothetical protein